MTRRLLPALAATLALTAAAPAAAVTPDRKVEVGAAPTFTFDGANTTASNVSTEAGEPICGKTPANYCDYTLVHVTRLGSVGFSFEMSATTDIDTYLYASDEKGEQGKLLKEGSGSAGTTETFALEADPGYYLVVAAYYASANSGFKMKGTFEASTPDGGPAPDVGAPAPTATPAAANKAPEATLKKASKSGFSGTSADGDGTVKRVEVAVVQKQGKACKQLTKKGTFTKVKKCQPTVFLAAKGTTAWSLKLKRKLKKGGYLVFVRAVDDKGAVQGGFSPASKKAFKVR